MKKVKILVATMLIIANVAPTITVYGQTLSTKQN